MINWIDLIDYNRIQQKEEFLNFYFIYDTRVLGNQVIFIHLLNITAQYEWKREQKELNVRRVNIVGNAYNFNHN